jgi:DNA invertase Pin-like site-specific DNA recombinase
VARTPTAWGYSRVSHLEGYKKGDSCESQSVRIKHYYDVQLAPTGMAWGGVDNDGENISAYRVKFQNRPAGRRLLMAMQSGDCLVVDKIDRLWRSIEDFVMLMKILESRGVAIHIVNFLGNTIKSNDPMGGYMLKHFVLVSELESAIKAERTREALTVARLKGLRVTRWCPPGTKLVPIVDKNGRVERNPRRGTTRMALAWCDQTRKIMKYVCQLVDVQKLSWMTAYGMIEEYAAKIEGRPVRPLMEQANDRQNTWKAYRAYENAFEYLGIREPSQIPVRKIVFAAAKQMRRERTERNGKTRSYTSKIQKIAPGQLLDLAMGR